MECAANSKDWTTRERIVCKVRVYYSFVCFIKVSRFMSENAISVESRQVASSKLFLEVLKMKY